MRVFQIVTRGISASMTYVFARTSSTANSDMVHDPAPAKAFELPFEANDPDDAEYRAVARAVADLMLADEWVELADQISEWGANLVLTPGGLRYHDIAVEVALSGLQSLLDTVTHENLTDLADADYEVACFVDTHRGSPDNHILALLAARAHMLIGNACRADLWPDAHRTDAWRRMARHFVEAGDILENFDARALMSPLIAEGQYLQALGSPGGGPKVPALFEDWIVLDPSSPVIYARHAKWLAEPGNASQNTILTLADEALTRTEDTLGLGGYGLFFQPLLDVSDDARNFYDAELYASAMLDLATQSATQADVNRAADALAGEIEICGDDAPVALKDTLFMLVRNEIKVCYPRLWTRSEDAIRALIEEAADAIPDINFDDLSKAA